MWEKMSEGVMLTLINNNPTLNDTNLLFVNVYYFLKCMRSLRSLVFLQMDVISVTVKVIPYVITRS